MVEVRSRSERRSEKRQSFIFVAFIVTVAIVCFASGFMVGRNTAPQPVDLTAAESTPRQPIADAKESAPAVEEKVKENLTFYEALPKGEQQPLGSGINLPPQEKAAVVEPATKTAAEEPAPKAAAPEKVFEAAWPSEPAPKPAASTAARDDEATTSYVLQVASFPQPDEAGKLLGRLTQGGYNVYVQQADLGSKGVWYRVFVGPVVGKARAEAMLARIEQDFKVKPLLRKQ